MKPTTLCSLLALSASAWAASPYDMPFGLQWNFMIGASGPDATNLFPSVTSDGTVFVLNYSHNSSTWGVGATGSINSGVGAITPLGRTLYGTTLRSLPGMESPGQNYPAGASAAGNTAYFGFHGAGSQYWSGQDTSDSGRATLFSLDSSSLSSIANQRRISKFKDNAGTPRTDGFGPILPGGGLNQPGGNRPADSIVNASTLDMIIVGNANGDFAFAGDYGGSNFGCFVGRYNLTTNTLTGPEKQPVAYDGSNAIVRSDYSRAGVDQSTGRYYGAGFPAANAATFDPDGAGILPPLAVDSTKRPGVVVAYDPATPPSPDTIAYTVVWESPTTGATTERINAIAPTNDGTNSVFFAGLTTGDMPGFIGTNANPNVNADSYIELRDATGALVWAEQFAISSVSDGIQSADVDSNGDLYVSGYAGEIGSRNSWVRKYKKTGPGAYTVAWTSFVENPLDPTNDLINNQLFRHAFDSDGEAIYLAVQTQGQWPNTNGFVYAGNTDLLLHKMSPGDFNNDGLVDFADVQIAGTATKPGLPGVDTYDFNRDGDSTLDDTIYMITNIMDRMVGDIAQDTLVSDVDNADIGKAIGALGVGTLYLDGDIDFDGDVDAADITAVAAAFTGAETPSGYGSSLSVGATLRYRASDGQVWLHAGEAAGDIITSFQLENAAGTFVPASFTGPAGGNFGGSLKEATASVLADTDLTLAGDAGTGGIISLGTVFPAGMDLAGLEAYLTTAVYTGQPGSGQMQFALIVGDLTTPYGTWAIGSEPFDGDANGDGVKDGLAFLLGAATPATDATSLLPTVSQSGGNLIMEFDCLPTAERGASVLNLQYDGDLVDPWTSVPVPGVVGNTTVGNVNFVATANGSLIHIVATINDAAEAAAGRLFGRLEGTE